jgi:hypothetical protein
VPLFLVRRTDPFAQATDFDAALFRSLAWARAFPGLEWIRSFYDEDTGDTFCIYEARSAEDVRRHSDGAHIPYDSIAAVSELRPDSYWVAPRPEPSCDLITSGSLS